MLTPALPLPHPPYLSLSFCSVVLLPVAAWLRCAGSPLCFPSPRLCTWLLWAWAWAWACALCELAARAARPLSFARLLSLSCLRVPPAAGERGACGKRAFLCASSGTSAGDRRPWWPPARSCWSRGGWSAAVRLTGLQPYAFNAGVQGGAHWLRCWLWGGYRVAMEGGGGHSNQHYGWPQLSVG